MIHDRVNDVKTALSGIIGVTMGMLSDVTFVQILGGILTIVSIVYYGIGILIRLKEFKNLNNKE